MLAQEYIQKVDDTKKSFYEIVGGENHLAGLKKINIFVGENNSGKSRFLRQMYTSNNEKFQFYENRDARSAVRLYKKKN